MMHSWGRPWRPRGGSASIYKQAASLNRDKIVSKVRLDIRGGSEDRELRTWVVMKRVSSAPILASRRKRKILPLESGVRRGPQGPIAPNLARYVILLF